MGEIVGELIMGIGRFIGHIFFELVLEFLIKGPGHIIVKTITKKETDPDGFWAVIIGILFWVLIGIGVYYSVSIFNE